MPDSPIIQTNLCSATTLISVNPSVCLSRTIPSQNLQVYFTYATQPNHSKKSVYCYNTESVSICLSVWLSVCLPIHLCVCQGPYLALELTSLFHMPHNPTIQRNLCTAITLNQCPSVWLSVCLPIHLCVCQGPYPALELTSLFHTPHNPTNQRNLQCYNTHQHLFVSGLE